MDKKCAFHPDIKSTPATVMRELRLRCVSACTASAARRPLRVAAAPPLPLAPPLSTARAAAVPLLERRRSSAATVSAPATASASP